MARGRGNGRTGLNVKVTGDVIRRLASVRALWLSIQNDTSTTVHDVAVEFYFAIGEILEGKTLDQIEFRKIDSARVRRHDEEG